MNHSWRWLCLSCAWLKRLLRVSVACALCRSFGGRNRKDSAFPLTVCQWTSGVVVDIEKGLWSCAFVLPVSACTHQHLSRRKMPYICGRPSKPGQSRASPLSVEELAWSPSASSMGEPWAGLHLHFFWIAHGTSWQKLESWANIVGKIPLWSDLAHDYKSIKGLR